MQSNLFLSGWEEHSLNHSGPTIVNEGPLQQVQGCPRWSVLRFEGARCPSCPCLADQAHEAAEQLCSSPGVPRVAPPLASVAAGGSLVPLPLSHCIPPTVNSMATSLCKCPGRLNEWGSWVFYLFSSTFLFVQMLCRSLCGKVRVLKLLVVCFKTSFWKKCFFLWICIKNLSWVNAKIWKWN